MIFGNKSTFAIEASLASDDATTPFGMIVLWIGNHRVGDALGGYDIPFVLESFLDPLLLSPATFQTALSVENGSEIIDELSRIRFADTASNFDEREHMLSRLRRFIIPSAYDIEGFDRFFVVVLRTTPGKCRFIWREKDTEETKEHVVLEEAYRSALVECYKWISKRMNIALAPFRWLELSEKDKDEVRSIVCKRDPKLLLAASEDKLLDAAVAEAFRQS